ncbi:hypothetical protein BGZ60DRAFT_419533 [Tricladium varicosporioides]|nr:hypothetical protein BGZ60DRAFT_419533 [Hymenoscyphus varicosporioides]
MRNTKLLEVSITFIILYVILEIFFQSYGRIRKSNRILILYQHVFVACDFRVLGGWFRLSQRLRRSHPNHFGLKLIINI